ncbi:type III PLP-dependent enzyme [Tropicibacter sp. S64]|uniref:type III PLP-dependent enzyme n=1 Tax=Tropicibacter sp. S64 TaxID=3415122 RepID=UPI003C7D9991
MGIHPEFTTDPAAWLTHNAPDGPVFFFSSRALTETFLFFRDNFPGMVTYAVKANPAPQVLQTLCRAGMTAFDVASPNEMERVRAVCPAAQLHYHNPVRSLSEIAVAKGFGIASWSIDRASELDKLGDIAGQEIAVRLKLPVKGAAYDFGSKFGADPDTAAALLRRVVQRGGVPSMTFHPGTQCDDPAPWRRYIEACAEVALAAGVRLHRLNVGGGFAAFRTAKAPDLQGVFTAIAETATRAFGPDCPDLVCEPGRAMVSEAYTLALTVKAVSDEAVFLDDGLYGALMEWRDLPAPERITVLAPDGAPRRAAPAPRVVFGPTCDSLDRLPEPLPLPRDLAEGDRLLVRGMGAYSLCLGTGFNGYGMPRTIDLE